MPHRLNQYMKRKVSNMGRFVAAEPGLTGRLVHVQRP